MKHLTLLLVGLLLCLAQRNYAQNCASGCNMYNLYTTFNMETSKSLGQVSIDSVKLKFNKSAMIHKQVQFVLPNTFKVDRPSYTPYNPVSVAIDFDDGNGIQYLQMGDSITVQYATGGNKVIDADFVFYDGSQNITYSYQKELIILDNPNYNYQAPDAIWELESELFTPPCSNAYPPNHKYAVAGKGYANAYIKYANPSHPVLTNPIIFVDGFDPNPNAMVDPSSGKIIRYGGLGWDAAVQGLLETQYEQTIALMPNQIDTLSQNGYDLIFLDFKDGTDYIQRNALLLMALIDSVNAVKDCNGDEIVIIGASMGGQIARYAMTKMESEQRNHGVRTYISFDSPHQGSMVPMSAQAAVWGLPRLSRHPKPKHHLLVTTCGRKLTSV